MPRASSNASRPGLTVAGTREMLLPFTVAGCFVLYQLVGMSGAGVAAAGAPFLVLYALAPSWARASITAFDRDLVRLLSSGRRAALPGRLTRALGMRLFAPAAVVAERRALVAAELGHTRQARGAFARAFAEYGPQAPLRVLLGYAHASYQLGEDREAIRIYERLLQGSGELPGVRRNLAHALVRRGEDVERALSLLDGPLSAGDDDSRGEHDLLRALAFSKLGEPERAGALLEKHKSLDSELAQRLRGEIEQSLAPPAARPVEPR